MLNKKITNHELIKKAHKLQKDIFKNVVSGIIAALGVVVGLAWNDAISQFIKIVFPENRGSIIAKFLYAVILTIVVVVISYILLKISSKNEEEN